MTADIRKIAVFVEETRSEMGRPVSPPIRKAAACAVLRNPFAGAYADDLSPLIDIGAEMGGLLGRKCMEALGIEPAEAESYGKAALVGEAGELEHAAAVLHPALGKPLRVAVGGGAAIIPSSKAIGGPGDIVDIPLGYKDSAYVRSHFDGMRIRLNDAPRAGEIVIAVAVTTGGRPLPRVGGLTVEQARTAQ
ncbi:amino acid synthesis family protein [Rhizobiaceae bacterium BDR2-2]|uniref:Amino acid synthesis family protein n=1 Tax=Ectorhizobium quercum TaxID=2965071 RepID=A0AAE3N0P2_9HYPH|nr:amino acid synthesis family protein [Ectorhizobium quercum]MCX8997976.1 amino acid synthesis family protein [Ectorhizobium quercum]